MKPELRWTREVLMGPKRIRRLLTGEAVRVGKHRFWPLFLLATAISTGEAQIRSNPDTGKPLVISPLHVQRSPPTHARKEILPRHKCLSRQEVHGERLRYRTVNGRSCWYAARPTESAVHSFRRTHPPPQRTSERPGVTDCEEQAMKLDGEEKRVFLRQCKSGNR